MTAPHEWQPIAVADVDRLAELLAKATPGPWELHSCINYGKHYLNMTGGGSCSSMCSNDPSGDNETLSDGDMCLIAAAVNALPELLRVYRAWLDAPEAEITREDWLENFTTFSADRIGQHVRLVATLPDSVDDHG